MSEILTTTNLEDVMTLRQTAEVFHVSDDTLMRWVKRRKIKCLPRQPHESYRFVAAEVRRYLSRGVKSPNRLPAKVPDELGLYAHGQ